MTGDRGRDRLPANPARCLKLRDPHGGDGAVLVEADLRPRIESVMPLRESPATP